MGEERWWDPADQAWAESLAFGRADLGRGWVDTPMVNNAERRQPFGDDPASAIIEAARSARRPTALDEGRAWRRRADQVLAVLRVEVFADADDAAHRAAWRDHGEAALDATWRDRWRERDVVPGWIEARRVSTADQPGAFAAGPTAAAADWIRIEDHTGADRAVTIYDHVTVWRGRAQVTLTVRHPLELDLDDVVSASAAVVAGVPLPPG